MERAADAALADAAPVAQPQSRSPSHRQGAALVQALLQRLRHVCAHTGHLDKELGQ